MPAEGSINDEIDGAQWTKYRGSRYLNLMISAGLDAAFNNAGVQTPALDIAEVNNVEFERVNTINLRGVWNCMKYEFRQMRTQGSGAIVNNSSIGGLIGLRGRAAYHASKHGVLGRVRRLNMPRGAFGCQIWVSAIG